MEWSRALDVAAGQMCPAVAIRQLLDGRRRRSADAPSARPVPAGRPARPDRRPARPVSAAPAPATTAGGGR